MQRIEAWAATRQARIRGHNPWLLLVRSFESFNETRVMGLAAEMAYYALVSMIPLIVALGAGLGMTERFFGSAAVQQFEDTLVAAVRGVFSSEMTDSLVEPLLRGLIAEERAGIAIGGLIITFWFAGGSFRAVMRALDEAYQVPEGRGVIAQWAIAYGLTVGAVLVTTVLLALVVVGPLLGVGRWIADQAGLAGIYQYIWQLGRWPVVIALAASYLAWVYRVGPNVENSWRASLPGAVFATIGTLLVATGFRIYLDVASPAAPQIGDAAEAVQIASQTIGVILAVILWLWLTSIVVLTGGVLNAELARSRGERPRPKA